MANHFNRRSGSQDPGAGEKALPTIGAFEVELEGGYIVAARDVGGQLWASVGIADCQFDASGALVFARDQDGNSWQAQASAELDGVVLGLRSELESQPIQVYKRSREDRAARTTVSLGALRSGGRLLRTLSSAAPSVTSMPSPRLATHLLVLGAVATPMSISVASAQTSPIQQHRFTVPLTLDDPNLVHGPTSVELMRSLAVEPVTVVAVPATPATPAAPGAPKAPAPTRAIQAPRPTAVGGGHFSWGWCTWWVASKRPIPWSGNAIEWWANARSLGFAEGSTPKVGAIMVTRESGYGHVAYVESVDGNGGFTVTEMNFVGFGVVSSRHFSSNPGALVGFIY